MKCRPFELLENRLNELHLMVSQQHWTGTGLDDVDGVVLASHYGRNSVSGLSRTL